MIRAAAAALFAAVGGCTMTENGPAPLERAPVVLVPVDATAEAPAAGETPPVQN